MLRRIIIRGVSFHACLVGSCNSRSCAKRLAMSEVDKEFMRRAINVGLKGIRSTAPNPWVGCVIAKDQKILSEGYHVKKGGPHAEINAFRNLGSLADAEGATLYVTLEPCCHHGATPPCTDAILKSGVKRVVVAIGADPDEQVSGEGVQILRKNGIDVTVGVCEDEASTSLMPYLHHRRTGMPYVLAKVGCSMNALIAYEDGTSKWITSEASRNQALEFRRVSQAIIVGVHTVLVDNPRLTRRSADSGAHGIIPFTRVIIDPKARLSSAEYKNMNVISDGMGPTLIFTTVLVEPSDGQVEWIRLGDQIDLEAILRELGRRGMLQVLVEGGATTLRYFMEAHLINRFTMFVAPTLIGTNGLPFYTSLQPRSITSKNERLRLLSVEAVPGGDGDIRIDYTV